MAPKDCTLIMPASGFSYRFGSADKLLADFNGRPLADYAARTAEKVGFFEMIAIVPRTDDLLTSIFRERGFKIVENPNPAFGQAHSIQLGARHLAPTSRAFCVMLADMPLVTTHHIQALIKSAPKDGVIKTKYDGYGQPPAIFAGKSKRIWASTEPLREPPAIVGDVEFLPLSFPFGEDIDTPEDLWRLSDLRL